MNDNDEQKSQIEEFLDEYSEKIEEIKQEALSILSICYERDHEDYCVEVEKHIDALKSFSSFKEKNDNLRKTRGQLRKTTEEKEKFDLFADKISDIFSCTEDFNKKIKIRLREVLDTISKCPFGEQEDRAKNAKKFEYSVMNLVDWLFVSELERINLHEIEDRSLRKDGAYKILPEFDTRNRCGFPFENLFIECKNYKKPDHKDLMQVFTYTLLCQESKIFQIPLSILISRGNPTLDSTTWKLRGVVFNRKIQDETRLILLLDQSDLENMVSYRESDGDPALVIKEKIEELSNWNIKHGGYQ